MQGEPGPCLTLCLGDFPGGHFLGNFCTAGLAFFRSRHCGEIEPFMRLDQVDIDAADTATKDDAQIVAGLRVPPRGIS